MRDLLILAVLSVASHGRAFSRAASGAVRQDATPREERNVVFVVADGLRWQDLFGGADSLLVFGDPKVVGQDAARVRQQYWRPTARERREALMPFLWSTGVREGMLAGNRDLGSRVSVTNGLNFSYPGYNEMLTGYPDARINSNEYGPNPNVTVFEWLNRRTGFRGRVGAVGTWTTFRDIFNEKRSGLYVSDYKTDALSHAGAMRYLREQHPRALFIGYGQTDDWAHEGRYDRVLDAAHDIDGYLSDLWTTLQSMPQYRGRTTVIVTADHGRGRTPRDWTDHGKDVAGAEEMWIAVIGPDARGIGERRGGPSYTLSQTAATVASVLGLDYRREVAEAAVPIGAIVKH